MPSKNAIKWGIFAFLVPIQLICAFSMGFMMVALQIDNYLPPISEWSSEDGTLYVTLTIVLCLSIPIGIVIAGVFIHMLYRFLDLRDPTEKQKRKLSD